MAQFSTLLPVLVLFTFCKPIVGPSGHFLYDRRDHVPNTDSNEYSAQQLGQSTSTIGSLLTKPFTYAQNNANYRFEEQQVETPHQAKPVIHRNYRDDTATLTVLEKNLRNLLNANQLDSDEMIGDQPDPSFEKYLLTPSSGELSLTKGKVETSTPKDLHKNETGPAYKADSKDCVEGDEKSGKPYCSHLRNYPEQSHIDDIIKTKFNNLESFFGEDSFMPEDINHRINPDEQYLCHSRTRVIYPESALNNDYEWMFIINTEKYRQGVRVEECINEGSVCGANTTLNLPNNFKATCRQHYVYRWLAAYANGAIIKHQFQMPSCCKCVLTIT